MATASACMLGPGALYQVKVFFPCEPPPPHFYLSFAFVPLTGNCCGPFSLLAFIGAQQNPYMFHRGQESPHERLSGYASGDSSSPILRSSSFGVLRRDSWVRKMVLVIEMIFDFCCPCCSKLFLIPRMAQDLDSFYCLRR